MTIKKTGKTTFEREYPRGDYNEIEEIEITKEGIEIECDLLEWHEILEACQHLVTKQSDPYS